MTIKCNQVQPSAIKCNHLEREEDGSDGDTRRDPIAERDHLWGEGGAVVSPCMRAGETRRDPSAERCAERDVPRACNEGGHQHAMREAISISMQ